MAENLFKNFKFLNNEYKRLNLMEHFTLKIQQFNHLQFIIEANVQFANNLLGC